MNAATGIRPGGALSRMRKLARFVRIYGPGRAWFKAAGRMRLRVPGWRRPGQAPDIGLIGCGQFAFATIGYFLQRRFGRRILVCYDTDPAARDTLMAALGVDRAAETADALFGTTGLKVVYIASNHASHASYAVAALEQGLEVYVEKPIAVDRAQLLALSKARLRTRGRVHAGYNRPFAPALRDLRQELAVDPGGGFTLACFVAGHRIDADHWYRRPEEGTRICGNVGHWLDLFVHVLAWRSLPERLDIQLAIADAREPDDNLAITMTSERGDLCAIVLTSRNEPFEGIHETISLQHGDATCTIDDFRQMTLRHGERLVRRRYWPKDPGHGTALLQPFVAGTPGRDWREVEASTLLMLHVADMVRAGERTSSLPLLDAIDALELEAAPS